MKKISRIITIIVIVAAVFLVGCGQKNEISNSIPQDMGKDNATSSLIVPDIVGEILEVKNDGNQAILVNSTSELVKGQVWVTITEETYFFEDVATDSSLGISNVSRDFVVGNEVSIVSTGDIAESYPMQATAASVYSNE